MSACPHLLHRCEIGTLRIDELDGITTKKVSPIKPRKLTPDPKMLIVTNEVTKYNLWKTRFDKGEEENNNKVRKTPC